MYVYEEMFEGNKLSEIINTENENKKYLPGIKLPKNVVRNLGTTISNKSSVLAVYACIPPRVLPLFI